MLHTFLLNYRSDLITRCRVKVDARMAPRLSPRDTEYGVPIFLGQLTEMLAYRRAPDNKSDGPDAVIAAEKALAAERDLVARMHGKELFRRGYTMEQVVHDYGDLCQAITELALELGEVVPAGDFHTLNLCLDEAIAGAVTEYGELHSSLAADSNEQGVRESLAFLAHELRNHLNVAMLSFAAIRSGIAPIQGATSAVHDRSLNGLRDLIDKTLSDARLSTAPPPVFLPMDVDEFISDVHVAAGLEARIKECQLSIANPEPGLQICTDKSLLYSALFNLLQNAFKFTHPGSQVTLRVIATQDRVKMEVEDQCGGLPAGKAEQLFVPFEQHGRDRSGLGLGLSIARRAVEACNGTLAVRDIPGHGCVFTIDMPRHRPGRAAQPGSGNALSPCDVLEMAPS